MAMTPELFWSTVKKLGGGKGCWTRGKGKTYGLITRGDGRTQSAHRYAYELVHGVELDDTVVVDHRCRNLRCVNPEHLEAVTQAENVRRGWEGRPRAAKRVAYALNIEAHLYRAAKKIARDTDRSLNYVINQAIEEFVRKRTQ